MSGMLSSVHFASAGRYTRKPMKQAGPGLAGEIHVDDCPVHLNMNG